MDRELVAKLDAALAELPDEQREIIVLHVQSKLPFREIAKLREISINTAMSRYRYGSGQAPFDSEWRVGIMTDSRDTERLVETHLEHLPTPATPGDAKVLAAALTAMHRAKHNGSDGPFDLENDHDKQSRQTDRGGRCRRRGVVRSFR